MLRISYYWVLSQTEIPILLSPRPVEFCGRERGENLRKKQKNAIKLYLLDFMAITIMNTQKLWPPAQKKA